jgi:hypothetical protein
MRTHGARICRGLWFTIGVATLILNSVLPAAPVWRASTVLPFSGGAGQLAGDLAWIGNGAVAVYAKPVGTTTSLGFYRMGPDAQVVVEKVISLTPWPCYEPAIAWDGENCGVAVSGFTQGFFLRLSAAGELLTGPVQLPGLPSGGSAGRTAAFKVCWTGQSYAVFGLWLERLTPHPGFDRRSILHASALLAYGPERTDPDA